MFIVVAVALMANGLSWAVHFPPLHPNDEPQHYLYAAGFAGGISRPAGAVPNDLQAMAELVSFGVQRTRSEPIDLSLERSGGIDRLLKEARDPEMAWVFEPDQADTRLLFHTQFERYHPPGYYAVAGQALRLGHQLGLGVRGRLLLMRLLSVLLGTAAGLLTVCLARVVWPKQFGLAMLVGLLVGWQAAVAFYTSVANNEVLAFLLATGFLLVGARMIRGPVRRRDVFVLLALGIAAITVKITMLTLVPLGLIAVALSAESIWARRLAWGTLVVVAVSVLSWLLIPLGGGGGMMSQYVDPADRPRSFPAEMFQVERVRNHMKMLGHLWGRGLGNAHESDARVPTPVFAVFVALTAGGYLLGLLRLRRADASTRRILLWLALAPFALFAMLYAIDYRFASIGGGRFFSRPQYFVPTASAVMVWTVWGLMGWQRGRGLVVAGTLAVCVALGHNLWFLFGLIGPRYTTNAGWWSQCEQAGVLWGLPPAGVALLDCLTLLTGLVALACLCGQLRRDQLG